MRTLGVVLVSCIVVIFATFTACDHFATRVTGQGTKVGTVIKLAQEGILSGCKTWEGELIRGGMTNGSGAFSVTPLYFTINDAALLAQVQNALDGQYEVEVTYTRYFGPMFCGSENDGNYFLTTLKRR
jgi:hypothetical protein